MKYAALILLLGLQLLVGCASTARLKQAPSGPAVHPPSEGISKNDPAEQDMKPPPVAIVAPDPALTRDTVPPPAFKIDTLFTLSFGPCRGKCPVYRVVVTNDGMVFWNGLQYVERSGLYFTRLELDQKGKLESWVATALQSGLQDQYPRKEEIIPDFPTRSFTLKLNNRIQQIDVNHSPPRQLATIEKQLLSWLERADWRLVPAK